MDNNKKESRSSALSVGKRLREAREKKSLTIEQVQKQTKIHSSVLSGLEEGRISDALTDTYVRSFLKKYAQFLDLNSVEILKEYYPARPESPLANIDIRAPHLSKEAYAAPGFLFKAITAIVAAALFILFIFLAVKISSASKKPAALSKKTSSASQKKAPPKTAKSAKKSKTAVKTKTASKEYIPKSTPLILEIRVKETVLVKLKRDGVLLFENVLKKGMVEMIVADNSIEIDTAKAASLGLILNGIPVTIPGNKGISSINITRKGIRLKYAL